MVGGASPRSPLNSDRKADLHSPVHEGFWWSHLGWILSDEYDALRPHRIADFAKFPELRWLDRFHLVPTVVYAVAVFLIGGWARSCGASSSRPSCSITARS